MVKYIMKETYTLLKRKFKNLIPPSVRQIITPRQLNAICLGIPKSGTTSIANLFSNNYRNGHEVERKEHVKCIYSHFLKEISDSEYIQYLLKRDNRLWLDIESNCFLGYRPDLVHRAFPAAKFILTVRAPLSWLGSIFDNNINFPIKKSITMKRWHTFFFQPDNYHYHQEEIILKDYELYPVAAYLQYWVSANKSVIESIPKKQLLIINTNLISDSLFKIANFLDVSESTFCHQKSRMNVTDNKHGVLEKLDSNFINDQIHSICNDFITAYALNFDD